MVFTEDVKLSLSSPISDELPCGKYLKNDRATFRPLRNEFNVAQTALRKLAQNPDESELEVLFEENHQAWNQLGSTLKNTFESDSRDIELIGWMLAVQLIVDQSVNGAANLIEWLNTLVDDQFDALNPVLPEEKLSGEGDELKRQQYEAKVKAFFQICGDSEDSSLIYAPLLMLPLVGDITFFQYRSAENKGTVNTLRQDAMQMLSSQKADVQQRIDNLDRLSSLLVSVSESVNKLTVPLQVKGVNFTFALSLIAKVQTALLFLTGLKPTKEQAAATAPTPETSSIDLPTDVPQNTAVEVMAQDNISVSVSQSANFSDAARTNSMNRDKAFAQLRELSEYFRVSEPHSPVSFLLEKAIRWGYMSLPELMTELMSDRKNEQDKIFNLIGLDNEEQVSLPSSASGTSTTQSTSNSAQEQQAASEPKAKPQESTNKTSSGSTGLRW